MKGFFDTETLRDKEFEVTMAPRGAGECAALTNQSEQMPTQFKVTMYNIGRMRAYAERVEAAANDAMLCTQYVLNLCAKVRLAADEAEQSPELGIDPAKMDEIIRMVTRIVEANENSTWPTTNLLLNKEV